ncbi:MAG: DUF3644 domain-containing protein [Sedimentisphaerales bacterium]|nr:DUF3644 domain-containing protein [Sedimentisphaerales bacterium]
MPRGLPKAVKDNIEKCQMSALAAVEAYNRPGKRFRTAQFLVMIIIAWTALLHAIFYRKGTKPWYKARNGRFERIDDEPKHWDLSECLTQYYGSTSTPERKNLEFLIGLRNKIEHRHLPNLDPSLYGECQAALLNLEELLVSSFSDKYALQEQLAVSLQFSAVVPEAKKRAARALAAASVKSVKDYIETFRGSLPSTVLNSMKYSFNVFLVPKVANRKKAADVAVEFIRVDEASSDELDRLEKLNVLIREKKIPIANLDLFRPGQVLEKVNASATYRLTFNTHADIWRHYSVRPASGNPNPEQCQSDFCVYDDAHRDYLYTEAWVRRCLDVCNSREQFLSITGREPILIESV